MKAYLVLIGSELLNGAMVETNSIYMANELNEAGIEIIGKIIVHDKIDEIVEVLSYTYNKADLIILSGGLGPTVDDLTKEAISVFLKKELVIDEYHKIQMEKIFSERGIPILDKNRKKEVAVIKDSIVFKNDAGIAPSFFIDKISAFPGVPSELKDMFPKFIKFIKNEHNLKNSLIVKDFIVWGIPESTLEEKIIELFDSEKVFLEFLVKDYGIVLRIVTGEENKNIIESLSQELYKILGETIIYEKNRPSEEVLVEKLKKLKLKISLAESCTGGMIAEKLVSVSGVSEVFEEGLVTYSNNAKIKRLGVSEKTLEKFGAVSKETVEEMLMGLTTDIGIAVSGIAGPSGGTGEKPVGTVVIGFKVKGKIFINNYLFKGNREKIRVRACYEAFNNLLQIIRKEGM